MNYVAAELEINEKRKTCFGDQLPFIVQNLLPWHYYIVKVKWGKSNPAHKAILLTRGYKFNGQWIIDNQIELFSSGYEDSVIKTTISKLYWFEIVSDLGDVHLKAKEMV